MYLTTEIAQAEGDYRRQHLAEIYRESRTARPHRWLRRSHSHR